MVRKSTVRRDPIGTRSEALHRLKTRESFRRQIVENQKEGLSMNTENLLQYNPKLADVSHTTRVAYAKFMTTKIKKEIKFEDEPVTFINEKERERGELAFNKFKANAGILKKRLVAPPTNTEVTIEKTAPSPSPTPEIEADFRARTPIQEDPNEDIKSPPPTPSGVLLEPATSSRKSSRDESSPIPKQKSEDSIESGKSLSPKRSPINLPPKSPDPIKTPVPNLPSHSPSPQPSTIAKSPEPIVTPKTNLDEEAPKSPNKSISENVSTPQKTSSVHLSVPGSSQQQPPPSPSISMTSDKGKSIISGKTLTGWL